MATRYGGDVHKWLLERGWKDCEPKKPEGRDFICGDRHVFDPILKKEMTVYDAAKLHRKRTGEYPEFLVEAERNWEAKRGSTS